MDFVQAQNLSYSLGAIGVVASITMALSGSPGNLSAATLGLSSGVLGSTAVTGVRMSRKEDHLKAGHVKLLLAANEEHEQKKRDWEALESVLRQANEEALQRIRTDQVEIEQLKASTKPLQLEIGRLQLLHGSIEKEFQFLKAAYAALQDEHEELKQAADRDWEVKEALEKEVFELKSTLNRSKEDIDRDIELASIKRNETEVQKAVAAALEVKLKELQDAHADIQKLLTRLNESNEIIQDTKDNAIPAIRNLFDGQMNSLDSQLMQLAGENDQLKRQIQALQAPKPFPGETVVDRAGNRIINHFFSYGVVLDALESISTPTGFRLRFKCDRNASPTKLTAEEFDKRTIEAGLMGLSCAPLSFVMDSRNLIVSVEIITVPTAGATGSPAIAVSQTIASSKPFTATAVAELVTAGSTTPEAAFRSLGCFPASEFEAIIKEKFVPRVRVVASSTGGKSPLLELIACGIAQTQGGELWLINPIPGSEKDWFHVPGVIAPGSDGIEAAIEWIQTAHSEFKSRRNDLPGTASKPFVTVLVDEVNAIARAYPDLGMVIKDFYQLSDHTRMGFLSAGQGANVSGISGGVSQKSTGNATKLMEEDFQNTSQVFTAQAAAVWLKKHKADLLPVLKQLEELCRQLNEAEGLSPRPKPGTKVVDRHAYRVALAVSPAADEPFFLQIPPYSSYVHTLSGVSFPKGATVTAPLAHQIALGLIQPSQACPHCGSVKLKISKNRGDRKQYRCAECHKYHTA
ncbi:hypothetical protein IFO70_29995 [Phormidium tenue FACHB-886]|nr:hypothetical protein [Phormidium tenue FACHB-886]